MITLSEHLEISEKMKLLEGESPDFSDEQLDNAAFYKLRFNPVTGNTELYLYDDAEQGLGHTEFEDAEIAIAFIEELFDLDDEDLADLNDYTWANEDPEASDENYDNRVEDALDLTH